MTPANNQSEAKHITATERFITDAIEGGWRWNGQKYLLDQCPMDDMILRLKGSANRFRLPVQKLLLDASGWRAVGKNRGWLTFECPRKAEDFIFEMFSNGKNIEEALQAVE